MGKIAALIDEKNVSTDWLEEIFDNLQCVRCDRQVVGFVDDNPVVAYWSDNMVSWKVIRSGNVTDTLAEIKRRLQAAFAESDIISETYVYLASLTQKLYFKKD